MSRTIVCIPAYNNERTIPYVMLLSEKFADQIYVIDDKSEDDTAKMAKELGARIVSHTEHQGIEGSLKTCIHLGKKKNVEKLVIITADATFDPEEIPLLSAPIDKGEADLVIGSRYIKDQKKPTSYGKDIKRIMDILNLGRTDRLTDPASLFRIYSHNALSMIEVIPPNRDSYPEIYLGKKDIDIKVIDVPVKVNIVDERTEREKFLKWRSSKKEKRTINILNRK